MFDINKCEGCSFEIEEAYRLIKKGYHLATCQDFPLSYPDSETHFGMIIVDDKGEIIAI